MSNVSHREIFELDFSCIFTPNDYWKFYADGTFTPEDRQRFLVEEFDEFGTPRTLETLKSYEDRAEREIFDALQIRAEVEAKRQARLNRTDEQKKADWIEAEKEEAREFNALRNDLRAWDNDLDESRPAANWRELEKYGV